MRYAVAASCVALCLTCPAVSGAQTVAPPTPDIFAPAEAGPHSEASRHTEAAPRIGSWETHAGFWDPFKELPKDIVRFVSPDTLKILSAGGAAAVAAHTWDDEGISASRNHLRPSLFTAGTVGGSALVQAGAGFGMYSLGRATGSTALAAVGSDLTRAQLLSQAIVQAAKFTVQRQRPDGSNSLSFPSGHTASAFATATVLQQHFGWKAAIPAYGFGAYVAASRMSANKHHLSDVLFGAAIGVAAGRTVTIGSGNARFNVGVTPTVGGAAITFTKH
jgi:membrane-associated phospholipid phosphatase